VACALFWPDKEAQKREFAKKKLFLSFLPVLAPCTAAEKLKSASFLPRELGSSTQRTTHVKTSKAGK
jgi:hypothetical protein